MTRRTHWIVWPVAALVLAVILFFGVRSFLWGIDPPERGVIAKGDLPITIDSKCVENALRKRFPDLNVMAGSAGEVPEGKFQMIFDYYHPTANTSAVLTFIDLGRSSRVEHFFLGHGEKLRQEVFPPALQAMATASGALQSDCGVDLSPLKLKPIGQHVDALD